MPTPGVMILPTDPFNPALLRGIKVNLQDPFKFDFIVDVGQSGLEGGSFAGRIV